MEILRQDMGTFTPRGDLHISEAEALRSALVGQLAASSALTLDLSGVSNCDTASFQLLCSLRKSADKEGKDLRISTLSDTMRDASAILGLSLENL
jgi:anti-anti-sigma factor